MPERVCYAHRMRCSNPVRALVPATLVVAGAVLSACGSDPPSNACAALATTPASAVLCQWTDYPGNPVIAPPTEPIVGDPTVVAPEDSPDGQWHLFAYTFGGIEHYTAPDGIAWTFVDKPLPLGAVRPYVFKEGGTYHLLFEKFSRLLAPQISNIQMIDSTDLVTWSDPVTLLEPTLAWEMETQTTVGNPFVIRRDGQYWLYYSAAGSLMPDNTGFTEPRYIGLARATDLRGPYTKEPKPIISPDPSVPWRTIASGSLKLLADPYDGRWVAMENGLYQDNAGATHSAIQVLESDDGVAWREVCPTPPLAPSGTGWKSAFVYAFATVRRKGDLRVYYNARNGWADGVERIGFSSVSRTCE